MSLSLIFVFFFLIDLLWVGVLSKPIWNAQIRKITGKDNEIRLLPAFIAYALLAFGLNYLAYSQVRSWKYMQDALFYGPVFGLVVYGIFNMTNMSIFEDYHFVTAIIDTTWGAIASTATLVLVSYLLKGNKFPFLSQK
jgi:uncharacterized membrane protein